MPCTLMKDFLEHILDDLKQWWDGDQDEDWSIDAERFRRNSGQIPLEDQVIEGTGLSVYELAADAYEAGEITSDEAKAIADEYYE